MNIDNLNGRYYTLLNDVNSVLKNTIESLGGSFHFVRKDDPILKETDDIREFGLPLVDAYTYNYGDQGNYYITSLQIGERGVEIYGLNENSALSVEDAVLLDYIPIAGLLVILENLPDLQ